MADKRFVAKNGLDNNSQTITNVADPVNAQDAATRAFASNASNLSSGTLALARGGTGASTQAGAANAILPSQTSQSGKYLTTDGTNVSWGTISTGTSVTVADDTATNATRYVVFEDATSGTVSTVNVSSTKLTFNPSSGTLAATVFSGSGASLTSLNAGNVSTGTLAVARGGTGLASYTIGDILYASGATTLTALAGGATGNALISGGTGTAPSWGKIGLTTHVTGTLGAANGGTGISSYTTGNYIYASGTTTLAQRTPAQVRSDISAELQQTLGVPRTNLGDPTVREMALFDGQYDNKIERFALANFWCETSTDGVTWTDASPTQQQKERLVGGDANNSSLSIANGTAFYRVRFRASTYVYLNAIYAYMSTQGNSTQVQVFRKHDNDANWTAVANSTTTVSSWPGHMYLPHATIPFNPTATQGTHNHEVYVVFIPTWSHATNPILLYKLQWWGGYPAARRNVYSTDEFGNVVFPAALTATTVTATTYGGTFTASGASPTFNTVDSVGTLTLGSSAAISREQRLRLVNSVVTGGVELVLNSTGSDWGLYDRNVSKWVLRVTRGATDTVTVDGNLSAGGTLTHTGATANLVSNATPTLNVGSTGTTTGSTYLQINGSAGQVRGVLFRSGSSARWNVYTAATAESGSDAGSPFSIAAYTDAGGFIDNVITILRPSGGSITLARPVVMSGTLNVTGTITGALSGNASTATTLATARTLWGSSFNGSADLTGALWLQDGGANQGRLGATSWHDATYLNTNLYYAGSGDSHAAANWRYIRAAGVNNIAGGLLIMKGNGTETGVQLSLFTAPTSTGAAATPASLNLRWRVDGTGTMTVGTSADIGNVSGITSATMRVGGDIRSSGTIYASDFVLTGGAGSGLGLTLDDLSGVVITSPSLNQVLQYNGTNWVNATISTGGASVTISDDTSTNANRYVVFEDVTSGTSSTMQVSSTKLTFNPSTGRLNATAFGGSGAELTSLNASNVSSGTLALNRGGTGATTQAGAANAILPSQTSQSGKYLTTDGTNVSWATVTSGSSVTVSDDTTTNATRYLVFEDATSGTVSTVNVASTKLTFNPSTGVLTAAGGFSGNATTATTLATGRTINGTSFNGSANITTSSWGTARTLTIGGTGKSVDGSAAVSWSLAEIGALALTGGTVTGTVTVQAAATQDAVRLQGRAGGTGSFVVTVTPTTLTASRTLTLANGDTTLVAGTMVPTSTSITINGTTNQITSSAGAQDLSANRTWTLSLPQNIHTGATPTFAAVILGTDPGGSNLVRAASARITSLGVGRDSSGTAGRIDASNDVVAFSSSDLRLKTNVVPLTGALAMVSRLSAIRFQWRQEPELKVHHGYDETPDIGLVAQEVEAVFPELVQERESGFKAVRYERMIPVLLQAIKELQQEVDALKQERA